MTLKCPNCDQPMADDTPFTPAEVAAAVEAEGGFESMEYKSRYREPVRHLVVQMRGKRVQVNLIEKIEPENMPSNEYDRQGETYKAFLIVEADGHYYRKEAHVDSYGEESWNGPVTRVNKVEKTIQVWE